MSRTKKDKPFRLRDELPRKRYHMKHLTCSKAKGNWNCPCCVPLNVSPAKAKKVLRKIQRKTEKRKARNEIESQLND